MSLWNHPRLTAALCTVAVLGCAAAPAVFLAAADAASLGRVETVADPYVAPTPTADDYYILRQLAARSRNAESEREQRPAEVLTAPKMYIGASASLQSMQYADSAAAEAAENALRQLARADSKDAQWYCLQGEILMNLHQYDSAHQSFREAVRREPDNLQFRRGAFNAAMTLKKHQRPVQRAVDAVGRLFGKK